MNLQDLFGNIMQRKRIKLRHEESMPWNSSKKRKVDKLIDMDAVAREAVKRAENCGIGFQLTKIDKVASRGNSGSFAEVSRERRAARFNADCRRNYSQYQFGQSKTEHILFIASGAFHVK